MRAWRISAGTACQLGKSRAKAEVLPTTGYVMLGEKCSNNCHFCAQARDSSARADALSRVTWPQFPADEIVGGLETAYQAGGIQRTCLQVVDGLARNEQTVQAVASIAARSEMPICVSSHIDSVAQAGELLAAGADKICMALDAATPAIYQAVKGADWEQKWELLTACAAAYPGKMTTHLIAGLGESEQEMALRIAACLQRGITVGLFAFTPVRGTALANNPGPALGTYRRIQIAHWLFKKGYGVECMQTSPNGAIVFSLPLQELINLLQDGKAFETSGCPDCNRPYYNERPGQVPYNYPRPLEAAEIQQALLVSGIGGGELV